MAGRRRGPSSPSSVVVRALLAWAPFALLWAALNVVTFDAPPGAALRGAVNAIGTAAVLGIGVWWMTGRLPWPARLRPTFYAAHVALGVIFSAGWLVASVTVGALLAGAPISTAWAELRPFFGWRLITGLWLYGVIAGVAYAIRIREALHQQEQRAIEAQALATRAQLDALRARLNPHFFFNALHALSGLIHRDPAQADDALDRIGQLLRRALATDGAAVVPLADEWDFTSDYLDLERLRLGDRLRVRAEIADEARDARVPPFSLQPLVENAVIHAVAPRAAGGTIEIRATTPDGRLRLEVSDDGDGPPGTLAEGHGLDLLRRRLAALFGDRATLTLDRGPAGGLRAVVELPCERE